MTLTDIQKKVKTYSEMNNKLTDTYRDMEKEVGDLHKRFTPVIAKQAGAVKTLREQLVEMIEDAKELFAKPKSHTLYGIKFGLRKKKGTLEATEKTVELIKKHFPDKVDELIRTKEEPVKEALANMTAVELKKIGVKVIADSDEAVVKSDFEKIEKFINSLIQDENKAA